MLAVGKITSKGQVTIPHAIRDDMGLKASDLLAWEIVSPGLVQVRKIEPMDLAYLRSIESTLTEWSQSADEEAYRDL